MKELNLPEKCEHGLIDKKGIYNDIFPLKLLLLDFVPHTSFLQTFKKRKSEKEKQLNPPKSYTVTFRDLREGFQPNTSYLYWNK